MTIRALSALTLLLLVGCVVAEPEPADEPEDETPEPELDPCEGIEPEVHEIPVDDLDAWLADGEDFALIDVHVPYNGEITGTDASIPFTDVDGIEAHLGYDRGATVVVYCLTGPMSAQAAAELVERGYCDVHDMTAGLYWWQAMGYPTENWGG